MSEQETNELISTMVRERNALRRERVCLEERLSRANSALLTAKIAAEVGDPHPTPTRDFDYPPASDLSSMLRRFDDISLRIEEISRRLDACC